MSFDLYSQTPASNDQTNYFATGMRPSAVKNAGWDIMADLAQFMSLPTSGGSANAQTITNTRTCGAWFTGMWVCWIPLATNTGAMTIAPDGLAAKNVFANGAAALAGQVVINVPAIGRYDGTQVQLINPQEASGSATVMQTGYAAPPTATLFYRISPSSKTVYWYVSSGALTGTSNATTMTWTGIPAIIQPATQKSLNVAVEDSGAYAMGSLTITASSGTWTWGKSINAAGGFTNTGTKATPGGGYEYSYSLD